MFMPRHPRLQNMVQLRRMGQRRLPWMRLKSMVRQLRRYRGKPFLIPNRAQPKRAA